MPSNTTKVPTVHRRGAFVTTPKPRSALLEIPDIADDIALLGHRHSMRRTTPEVVRTDATLARIFEVRRGKRLFHSMVVHLTCVRLTRITWVDFVPAIKNYFRYPGSRYTLESQYKVTDVLNR
jgi:hypothetical protein